MGNVNGLSPLINKNVNIKFSAHDRFLKEPSSGTLNAKIFESQVIESNITPVLGEENFSLKIHLEYGGTFPKLFMHVSSRNMFPTTRNVQIRVHVFRPRHCCGD